MQQVLLLISAMLFISGLVMLLMARRSVREIGSPAPGWHDLQLRQKLLRILVAVLLVSPIVATWVLQPQLRDYTPSADRRVIELAIVGLAAFLLPMWALMAYALLASLKSCLIIRRHSKPGVIAYHVSLLVLSVSGVLSAWSNWYPWKTYLGHTHDVSSAVFIVALFAYLIAGGWRNAVSLFTTGRVSQYPCQ